MVEKLINEALSEGVKMHVSGKLDLASKLYASVLNIQPQHADANHNMGLLKVDIGNYLQALPYLHTALEMDENIPQFWLSYIETLLRAEKIPEATKLFSKAIRAGVNGKKFDELGKQIKELSSKSKSNSDCPISYQKNHQVPFNLDKKIRAAKQKVQEGEFSNAKVIYEAILKKFPKNKRALKGLTNLRSLAAQISKDPPQEKLKKLSTLYAYGRFQETLSAAEYLLISFPNSTFTYNIIGACFSALGSFDMAVASYAKAIEINPDYPDSYNNLGVALSKQGNLNAAIKNYKKALKLKPEYVHAYYNIGNLEKDCRNFTVAHQYYQKALAIEPDNADVYCNIGIAYKEEGKLDEAISSFENAVSINPNHYQTFYNMGNTQRDKGDFLTALNNYKKALEIQPNFTTALAEAYHLAALMSDWRYIKSIETNLLSKLLDCEGSVYGLLALEDEPAKHLERTKNLITKKFQRKHVLRAKNLNTTGKLKIGYFSSYFRRHPVSVSIAQVIELHDKSRFETYAFHYGPDTGDEYNVRMKKGFDHFFNVSGLTDEEIAQFAAEKKIDIAIELSGHMHGSRVGILAHRPAAIQINYLGHPGTMGANFYDYIIADKIVIPKNQKENFCEKVVYLPNCYLPIDNTRKPIKETATRAAHYLPENAFVFCDFNNSFKISGKEFDIWMKLLTEVDGSVLWLLSSNKWSDKNLKLEAAKRGVEPKRIIFAKNLPLREHLSRHKLADLFLDTFNFNAHGTAVDALSSGVPVITKMGKGFTTRLAGGLLHALDMSELITYTDKNYHDLALTLATSPVSLKKVKEKLLKNLQTSPLFDTETYTHHLENAYITAYARFLKDERPIDFTVEEKLHK